MWVIAEEEAEFEFHLYFYNTEDKTGGYVLGLV